MEIGGGATAHAGDLWMMMGVDDEEGEAVATCGGVAAVTATAVAACGGGTAAVVATQERRQRRLHAEEWRRWRRRGRKEGGRGGTSAEKEEGAAVPVHEGRNHDNGAGSQSEEVGRGGGGDGGCCARRSCVRLRRTEELCGGGGCAWRSDGGSDGGGGSANAWSEEGGREGWRLWPPEEGCRRPTKGGGRGLGYWTREGKEAPPNGSTSSSWARSVSLLRLYGATSRSSSPRLLEEGAEEVEATGSVAVAAAAATSAGGDGGEQEHSAKREPPPSAQYLEVLSPEKREEELEYAAHRKELDDELEAFQAQIRQGVEKNGYFLVDESYLEETAAYQAMVNEQMAKLDLSRVVFGDWEHDMWDNASSHSPLNKWAHLVHWTNGFERKPSPITAGHQPQAQGWGLDGDPWPSGVFGAKRGVVLLQETYNIYIFRRPIKFTSLSYQEENRDLQDIYLQGIEETTGNLVHPPWAVYIENLLANDIF
uniref:Uncharacterized protein n=1 Tax=Oryza punctata TaxID=4537 RepID=A0A0E0L1K6_ORYPU